MKRLIVSLVILWTIPLYADQIFIYPAVTEKTGYGLVIEDCIINDNISFPSFAVHKTDSTTTWEYGITFFANWRHIKLYSGIRTGFIFMDGNPETNEYGHNIYGDIETRYSGTYYPALLNVGIIAESSPVIIIVGVQASYMQYDREWRNIGSEGYEVAITGTFGAGVRFDI